VKRTEYPTFNIEHPLPNVPAMSERQPLDVERWMLVVGCFPFDHLFRVFNVFRNFSTPSFL
jgi:hypothetical protein